MGLVYTDITLENPADVVKAREGFIKEPDIRRVTAKAMVDTGAWNLVINEATRAQLGLHVVKESKAVTAGGKTEPCGITEAVTVRWHDRFVDCNAVVLRNEDNVLLGAFPLEGMDLMVHPRLETVVGAHGDEPLCLVK
ncbi:MAG: retroviral-like aspartic protease family protein [Prevotellaceae bacterium]|nr:retroviral-like aspartic protease family protein [Prevotellaceae bacterium]